ncbi:hypothetical protein I543_1172 [Mycobacteroides abscessus 21]|uniref:Uncharacterized protein n=1 Tax=Mycobacteroides abscessus 21 TaxID=1299324 RepID=A0A829Q975_9MYCO|nr:hypothetical protein I543_1172 [Mycobacteroides abscessus 21]
MNHETASGHAHGSALTAPRRAAAGGGITNSGTRLVAGP